MTENGILDWTEDEKNISVNVNYDDPTVTPPLKVTPGDADALRQAAEINAKQLGSKMYGKDVRAALAQWVLLSGYMLQNGLISLQQFQIAINSFQKTTNARVADVEQRMTSQETAYTDLIKKLTDADKGDAAAEVIAARDSSIYGAFPLLDDRLEALEAAIAPYVANTSTTATLSVNLGRQVPISVTYYEYALGMEPEGLGTGPYGLGGSVPVDVAAIAVTWPDADTAQVALPVIYKDIVTKGSVTTMADGSWTITNEYKTLRFVADN